MHVLLNTNKIPFLLITMKAVNTLDGTETLSSDMLMAIESSSSVSTLNDQLGVVKSVSYHSNILLTNIKIKQN